MMSQHRATDDKPIYTSTRVPPAESADRVGGPTVDVEPDPDGGLVQIARVIPTVSRSG